MATPASDALLALGYTLTEINPDVWLVEGFGVSSRYGSADLPALLGANHVERAFQYLRPEAADVRRRLLATGHTVTRPDPLQDVFNIAGPLVNATGIGHVALVNRAATLDAFDAAAAANERTIRTQLTAGIVTVETHLTNLAAASPTPAQQKAALIFALRASKQLARLALRVLDSAD